MSRGSASSRRRFIGVGLAVTIVCLGSATTAATEPRTRTFSTPEEAFDYLHQVARNPRCVNCHGMDRGDGRRMPTVGDAMAPHPMNVTAQHNPDGLALGIKCTSCHGTQDSPEPGGPPGVADGCPEWQMPIRPMTVLWPAMTKRQLCAKWRDAVEQSLLRPPLCPGPRPKTARDFFVEHIERDHLIEWAFTRGPGREPAPGSFKQLKAAARMWAPTLEDPAWCESIKEERSR